MKAKEILELLGISRSTLSKYVKQGKIKATTLPSGRYEYDEDSVYVLMGKGSKRKNVIYVRSYLRGKEELEKQKELIANYCLANGISIDKVYEDIGPSLDLKRPGFISLVGDILDYKIKKVFLLYREKFSLLYFDFFEKLFERFGTKLIPVGDRSSFSDAEKEILKETEYFFEQLLELTTRLEIKERVDFIKKALMF